MARKRHSKEPVEQALPVAEQTFDDADDTLSDAVAEFAEDVGAGEDAGADFGGSEDEGAGEDASEEAFSGPSVRMRSTNSTKAISTLRWLMKC